MMTGLTVAPLLAVAVLSLLWAEARGCIPGRLVFKPASTLLVVATAFLSFAHPRVHPTYAAGILVALVFSLGGDVALMFKQSPRPFMAGLLFFLLAHVAYAVTFTVQGGTHAFDLISAVILLALGIAVFLFLRPGLGTFQGPVALYILVISLMVNRAISTLFSPSYALVQGWLITAGAILFWVSDFILAVDRFHHPLRWNYLLLVFYYAGQYLIALSPSYPP